MEVIFNLNHHLNIEKILSQENDEIKNNSLINNIQIRNNNYYHILKYDRKNLTEDNYKDLGKFRSLIYKHDKLLSFSPPKSLLFEDFITTYPLEECFAEEFVEGTMINVFYDHEEKKWEFATRSVIGAEIYFFDKNITFNKMFLEACDACNLDIDKLDPNYSYTFILQHPANRIVMPISFPLLYLLKVYSINNWKIQEINLEKFCINNNLWNSQTLNEIKFRLPLRYPINSYQELIEYFASMNTYYGYPGIMIYHTSGERTKLRNPVYEDIRFLRGNQPKLQFQYFVLRKKGRIKDYLTYYPEHKIYFSKYRSQLHRYTENLHQNYIKCYINKENSLKEFPFQYRIHLFNLHKKYLEELRESKQNVSRLVVINYVNSLEPAQIMYILNYNVKL